MHGSSDTNLYVSIQGILYMGEYFVGENLVNNQQFAYLKLSNLVATYNNHLANLFVHQTFLPRLLPIHFCQTLMPPNFQISPLYYSNISSYACMWEWIMHTYVGKSKLVTMPIYKYMIWMPCKWELSSKTIK